MGMAMKILRLKIYQPQAHYRIPFTYQRRHTYPLPPYSTVIGFLVNALGIINQEDDLYKNGIKNLKISIAGKFESKTTEYIWFRNLSKEKHIQRFGYVENREVNGHVEHIGGQSPMSIDVLNEVHLLIYLYNPQFEYLLKIKDGICNPQKRLEILHLGRAEDWIVIEEEPKLLNIDNFECKQRDADYKHFFWIPEKIFQMNNHQINVEKIDGLLYNLPTFCEIENYQNTFNRHGARRFEYIRTKLNDGKIKETELLLDKKLKLPIFLGDFNGRS
ncbi:TPA: type I-B CRISPR-associated protein Cas5 [bacterium]|nr:type I-B CRISPR-associated protein Cas5 [bacterium]